MAIPRWDTDGLFHDSPTEFERKVGESYRGVWEAVSRETPKGRLQSQVPVGFLNTHDRQIEFPAAPEYHAVAAQRFVAFARAQLTRKGYLGKSSDELRVLTVMRQLRVWNVVAPHFGTTPGDWSGPYIDLDRGLDWIDQARNRYLPNRLFRWRVRHFDYLHALTDFNVLNYIMGIWLLLPRDAFPREVVSRGYVQKLLTANVGGMGRVYPAMGVAKREPYWQDLEKGFNLAVANRVIPVSYDGTEVKTLQDVIAYKQKHDIPLSESQKRYLRMSQMSDDERTDVLLRGLARWKNEHSSTP